MKNLFCCLVISVFLLSCVQEEKSPIEGAWELVFMQGYSGDSLIYDINTNFTGSDMKMWSKDHFIFVGEFHMDTTLINNYGGGTYILEGTHYKENILFHAGKDNVGKTVEMILEIKNDTLIQTWPVKENGQIDKSSYSIEKYVRFN